MKKILIIILIIISTNKYNLYSANSYENGARDKKNIEFFGNFLGGLTSMNEYYAPTDKNTNLENVYYDDYGMINGRTGFLLYSDLEIDDYSDFLYQFIKTTANVYNLVSIDTRLFSFNFGINTEYNMPYDITSYSNYERSYVNLNNQCYIGDGYNSLLKFNGSEIKIAGITKPTNLLTVSVYTDTGNIDTSVLKYRYTYYSDTINWNITESNPNEDYTEINITGTDKSVQISGWDTSITTTNDLVNKVRLWRTKDGLNIYYLLAEIDITDTNYIDYFSDNELGLEELNLTDRKTTLISGKYQKIYKNINFVGGNSTYPDRLYFSEYNLPEYMSELNYFKSSDGEAIKGLGIANGHLVWFTEKSTYTLYIPDEYVNNSISDNYKRYWRITEVNRAVGCISNQSIAETGKGITFVSNEGVYSFGVSFVGNLTANGLYDNVGLEIKSDYDNYIARYPELLRATYFRDKYYLSYSTNGIYNNKIWVFNTKSGKGTFYVNLNFKDIMFDEINDYAYATGTFKDGKVYEFYSGSTYDGEKYFDNYLVDTITQVYSDIYTDTLYKITFDTYIFDKVLTDTVYTVTDKVYIENDGYWLNDVFYDTYEYFGVGLSGGIFETGYLTFEMPDYVLSIDTITIYTYYLGSYAAVGIGYGYAIDTSQNATIDYLGGTGPMYPGFIIKNLDTSYFNISDTTVYISMTGLVGSSITMASSRNTNSDSRPYINITYKTKYNYPDKDDILQNQTLFCYDVNDSSATIEKPILFNDSVSVTIYGDLDGCTIGNVSKSGSRKYLLKTVYDQLNSPTEIKQLDYFRIDMFSAEANLRVKFFLDDNDTYILKTSYTEGSMIRYDEGSLYDDGLRYDSIYKPEKIKFDFFEYIPDNQFEKIQIEVEINTIFQTSTNQYFFYIQNKGKEYKDY